MAQKEHKQWNKLSGQVGASGVDENKEKPEMSRLEAIQWPSGAGC